MAAQQQSLRKTLIYITSDNRSGSTLLDYLLSNHDQMVSVGELLNLDDHLNKIDFGSKWNWCCSCGQPPETCLFWSKVIKDYSAHENENLHDVRTKYFYHRAGWLQLLISLLVYLVPNKSVKTVWIASSYGQAESHRVAVNYLKIVSSISRCTGRDVIIDSSKYPYRLYALLSAGQSEFDIKVIHLVRDCRAVSYSKTKRAVQSGKQTTYFKAMLGWLVMNLEALNLRTLLARESYIRVSYEALCEHPAAELSKICRQFKLPFIAEMARLVKEGKHNIGGSPHRFDASTEIKLDARWKTRMSLWRKIQYYCTGFWLNKVLGN